MTKDEFKRQYIKWAGICGIAEDLGEDLDDCVEKIMQGIPPSILETAGEADIEKTTIAAVLSTRFARDWGEKTLNAQVALFSICCSGILYQMQSEIDALKDKARWRKQSEEPAPIGQELEIYSPIQERVFSALPKGLAQSWFWRPLDLPNLSEEEVE